MQGDENLRDRDSQGVTVTQKCKQPLALTPQRPTSANRRKVIAAWRSEYQLGNSGNLRRRLSSDEFIHEEGTFGKWMLDFGCCLEFVVYLWFSDLDPHLRHVVHCTALYLTQFISRKPYTTEQFLMAPFLGRSDTYMLHGLFEESPNDENITKVERSKTGDSPRCGVSNISLHTEAYSKWQQ
jgi:hypothetical protein